MLKNLRQTMSRILGTSAAGSDGTSRRPIRSLLGVEALEDRQLLTATLQVVGTTLNISSSNPNAALNETVRIVDRGFDSGTANIRLQLDGVTRIISSPIRTINVNLGRGNDTVTYSMDQVLRSNTTRTLNVNLGDGNDSFTMNAKNLEGRLTPIGVGTSFQLNVNGGAGADSIRMLAMTTFFDNFDGGGNTVPWTLNEGSRFSANLQGGAGNDTIRIDQQGGPVQVKGANFSLAMSGGEGTDSLVNTLGVSVENSIQTTSTYITTMNGGAGNDFLQVLPSRVNQPTTPKWEGSVALTMDGSDGNDIMQASVNADLVTNAVFSGIMLGGAGADIMSLDYRGTMDGTIFLNMDGGLGNDNLRATLTPSALSKGKVGVPTTPATVRGGAGDDVVRFLAVQSNPALAIAARMLGDAGRDTGVHSPTTVQARSTANGGDFEVLFQQNV